LRRGVARGRGRGKEGTEVWREGGRGGEEREGEWRRGRGEEEEGSWRRVAGGNREGRERGREGVGIEGGGREEGWGGKGVGEVGRIGGRDERRRGGPVQRLKIPGRTPHRQKGSGRGGGNGK